MLRNCTKRDYSLLDTQGDHLNPLLKTKRKQKPKRKKQSRHPSQKKLGGALRHRPLLCEADVPSGLETIALRELRKKLGGRMDLISTAEQLNDSGSIQFTYSGNLQALFQLQTVLTVYVVHRFDVARPSGLLAHESFTKLVRQLTQIVQQWPRGAFQSLGISAAGSDSDIMIRLRDELAAALSLEPKSHEMDMLVRIRRATAQLLPEVEPIQRPRGWDVLMRLSPRPLSVRFWRVQNMDGALNAAVAHAMVMLTRPKPDDVFLNLMCGSGTLLIERLAFGDARRVIGCDISVDAREAATKNLGAAGVKPVVELKEWDARDLHLPDDRVDAVVADLPFGFAIGTHDENVDVYPAVLAEAGRVAKPGARFVAITHEIKLLEQLANESDAWDLEEVIRINLRGLHPRIFVMKRK